MGRLMPGATHLQNEKRRKYLEDAIDVWRKHMDDPEFTLKNLWLRFHLVSQESLRNEIKRIGLIKPKTVSMKDAFDRCKTPERFRKL